jgi:hypothetical protein
LKQFNGDARIMMTSVRIVNKPDNSVDKQTTTSSELFAAQKNSKQPIALQKSLEGWIAGIDWGL